MRRADGGLAPAALTQPAGSGLAADVEQRRVLDALLEPEVAAWRKPAAGRPVDGARHSAADDRQLRGRRHAEVGDRAEKALGVGVLRVVEDAADGRLFDDLAGV